ncbi:MAG: DUF6452 family protein [Salinivirgaceae bacterium]
MKNRFLYFITLIVAWALPSCNSAEVECPGDSTAQLRLEFTQKEDSTTTQFTVYCPGLPDNINDTLVSDTIYNGKVAPIIQLEIPVDITTNIMAIYMDFVILKTDTTPYKKVTDSIKFEYIMHSYMNELECGIYTEFAITSKQVSFSNSHIDTAFFTYKLINSDNVNHVEIYY